jgi:hypothetical protein
MPRRSATASAGQGVRPTARLAFAVVSAQPSEHRSGRRRFRLFRKCLFGYHPQQVHQAIELRDAAIVERDAALQNAGERVIAAEARVGAERAELAAHRAEAEWATRRIGELERVSARLATMVVDRDKELRRLRDELQHALQRDDGARALAALAEDLEMVRRQARRQATRIRMRALREAAEVARRVAEAESAGDEGGGEVLAWLREAIERVGAEAEEDEGELVTAAESNGYAPAAEDLFDGLVEVEVGPLDDFSQLVGFEDAASGIGATSEISVKRFTQGRATLAMRFKHPVDLLRELEERAPFEFKVRDTRSDRIVLDLDE